MLLKTALVKAESCVKKEEEGKQKVTTVQLGGCHKQIDLISLANHCLKCISKSFTSNIISNIAVDGDQYISVSFHYYYHALEKSER